MDDDLKLDLRFIEIESELFTLQDYLEILARNLPAIVKAENERIWQGHTPDNKDRGFDFETFGRERQQEKLDKGITTRFLSGSALIAIWAIYESTIATLASYVAQEKKIKLKMTDIRGNFLERARKYFDEVLRFDLHTIGTDWDRLVMLATIRHAIAHANGYLPGVKQAERKKIEAWATSTTGVFLEEDYLIILYDFVEESGKFITRLLEDLIRRVRDAF